MKFEIRNSKFESNSKFQCSNVQNVRDRDRFEHLNLIRISSFEFRVSHPRAFTLVEVLAAIGILAVVLPVIMYSLDLAGNAALLARHRTQATMLAQAKLDEFIVLQDFSVASGDFGEQYPEYTWTIELTDWDTPDGLSADTLQLDVIVSWTQRNRIHEAKLSTLLYQSSASSSSSGGLVP